MLDIHMPEEGIPATAGLSPEGWLQINSICERFEEAWQQGQQPSLEDYGGQGEGKEQAALLCELLKLDVYYRKENGEHPQPDNYLSRFPDQAPMIVAIFQGDTAARPGEPEAPATLDLISLAESVSSAAHSLPAWPSIPGYKILKELEPGGMGVVYKASDLRLKHTVAIKMIRPDAPASAEQRVRFQAEAEALAALRHPHIVQVYAFGEYQEAPFFVMEFLEAGALKEKLQNQPQLPRDAARLVLLLGRAIHAAHQQGLVHRDLKPANVLLAPAADEPALNSAWGWPKISDFGLVKRLAHPGQVVSPGCAAAVGPTQEGSVLGTPPYMAPEQVEGITADIGPPTDVYALGVILYELLTGRPPFQGKSRMDTLILVVSAIPVPPRQLQPDVPAELEAICLKCLEKKPAERFATAADLAAALQRFLERQPVPTHQAAITTDYRPATPGRYGWQPAAPTQKAATAFRRRRWLLAAALGIAVLALATVLVWRPWEGAGNPVVSNLDNSKDVTKGKVQPKPLPVPVPKDVPPAEPLRVEEFNVLVWSADGSKSGISVRETGALPVDNKDWIQVQVKLNQPGYVYLLWLDSEGHVTPLYPWNPENKLRVKDFKGSVPNLGPRQVLSSPASIGKGWKMGGPRGLEAILLLVRRTPLPPNTRLDQVIGLLKPRPFHREEEVVVQQLEGDQLVVEFQQNKRRPEDAAGDINNDSLQLCRRLQHAYQLDALRMIDFAHQEE